MDLQSLRHTVAAGEGLHTEFKRKLPAWDKLAREIVAFANTDGGSVLVGVDDDGSLVGVRDPRALEEVLPDKIRAFCRPAPEFEIGVIPLTRKRAVVAIHVPRSLVKPHLALETPEAHKGLALIRIHESSTTASREMYDLLKYEGKERNMKVEYGDKERVLMQWLQNEPYVTVPAFSDVARIPRQVASRTLVHLTKANVLRIAPQIDADDQFFLCI